MHINFDWDESKRQSNLAKHGVDFDEARAFDFETAVLGRDMRGDYGEERFLALGKIGRRVHLMVFTLRGDVLRVISLRKANKREVGTWQRNQT